MPAGQRRAVWLLGLCQCVLWGVLYYSFSVLLVPMEQSFGIPRTAVAGAFSAALLAMALASPAVGRRLDAGQAAGLFRAGTWLALAGLALVVTGQHAIVLYIGWLTTGIAMAMLLYEPAFALVVRAIVDQEQRLRALAAVTVAGGLASTLFLPLLSLVVEQWNWRAAVVACMAAVLVVARVLETQVLPALPAAGAIASLPRPAPAPWPPKLPVLAAIFGLGTLASMALLTLLIPLLLERGASPAVAGLVLAAFGIAQLPGRVWLLRSGASSRMAVHILPIVLQGLGLLGIVVAPGPWLVALAVAVFGAGAGLQALARPWLVQRLYGDAQAGQWNGELARVQGFARAAGPVAAAGAAWAGGAPAVLAGMGALLLLAVPLARRLPV